MTTAQQARIAAAGCEVRFDQLTRQLYATDASIYQIEPSGVAFPCRAEEASAVIQATADENISITPRGAGTSLVGNAIGEGLIVDFSRHNRKIDNLDIDNLVVAELVIEGTFLGPLPTPAGPVAPTGAKISVPTADFFYLRGGKIETFNCYLSLNIMLAQMGVNPDFASAVKMSAVTA